MPRLDKEHSGDVSDEGDRIRARRERLGLDKRHLAADAGISRETLAAIEGGQGFRRTSLTKIERVLDKLEAMAGLDAPPAAPASDQGSSSMVTFRLGKLTGDVDVVVEGSHRGH